MDIDEVIATGQPVTPELLDQLILIQLKHINKQLKQNSARLKRIEDEGARFMRESKENPSLLWLMRNKPQQTAATIALVFIVLSSFWVSTVRAAALKWLGLPVF